MRIAKRMGSYGLVLVTLTACLSYGALASCKTAISHHAGRMLIHLVPQRIRFVNSSMPGAPGSSVIGAYTPAMVDNNACPV